MKHSWLHQLQWQKERLIVFCNGWGMDGRPFQHLGASETDVLMLFDYRDLSLDCDLAALCKRYQSVFLVSWSMGVWVGQQIFRSWSHCLSGAVAINGTLCPIHDHFGIPVAVYGATLEQLDATSLLKFYRRMCRERKILDTFLVHQPQRSVENQRNELAALQEMARCEGCETAIYQDILIADQDLVFPASNQLAFWQRGQDGQRVHSMKGSHFPFYDWKSWDDLLNAAVEAI